ncbi:hypothetical protein KI387_042284, partial [Taxus chinensis]
MEEVEQEQQDNNEAVYLSVLEDYFDEEEPVEFSPFSLSSSTFQTPEPAAMKESFHLQQPASYNSPLESKLEDSNLPCSSLEKEKGQKGPTISSTSSIQEGLQEDSILGVENHSNGHIKRIRPCPIRYLASLEPKEKPQPVMLASEHEDELQSTKDQLPYLSNPNAEQLKE